VRHVRAGNDQLAAEFLVFLAGETLIVYGSAMELAARIERRRRSVMFGQFDVPIRLLTKASSQPGESLDNRIRRRGYFMS
jgi:hypothetical protein